MCDIHDWIGKEVKIGNIEAEITKVWGASFVQVEFFNINEGMIPVHVDDIKKYIVS